jgi:eukaryotic-like serine/threonine-protein kinase
VGGTLEATCGIANVSGEDPSVTSVAGPSLVCERTPDIERGMVLAGRYQIEAVLGKGGSGLVLRAFDRSAQMVVAVKVLKQELLHDPRWSMRFARELRLGRVIRHRNVCRTFDIGEGDGYRFLTMELATGGTLRDLVKKGRPLRPIAERLADARAAISGLSAIHEAGIVHCDVKPDNMLRMEDGRLVLSDLGLATDVSEASAVTIVVGTPRYMAPEIRAGEPATQRSDVWALGIALYEICLGRRPEGRCSNSTEGYSKRPAPLTSTPMERAMLSLCESCLAEIPLERPANASAVGRLFEAARRRLRVPVRRTLTVPGVSSSSPASRSLRQTR